MNKQSQRVILFVVTIIMICAMTLIEVKNSNIFIASALSENGFTYKVVDGDAIITGSDSTVVGDVVIPPEIGGYAVKVIDGKAFEFNDGITSMTIPDSVTSIGYDAFSFCTNLKSIKLSDNITEIEYETFWGCESLKHIDIPYGVKRIGSEAFTYSGLESVNIPDSVTEIARRAFSATPLRSVEIPASVKLVDNLAFSGCYDLYEVKVYNPDCEIYDSYDTIYHEAVIYGYPGSTAYNYAVEYDMVFVEIHDYINSVTKEATCTETGSITYTCSICGEIKTKTIPLKDHSDKNNDGKCDMCGKFMGIAESNPSDNCSCNCHKGGIAGFFFKIILFFQKLFGINKTCGCGINHY